MAHYWADNFSATFHKHKYLNKQKKMVASVNKRCLDAHYKKAYGCTCYEVNLLLLLYINLVTKYLY